MTIVTASTRPASHPRCRFCTPSSRSIISSARLSASALTSAAGWCRRATSSLTGFLSTKSPARVLDGASTRPALPELDALFREILDRARVPRDRRVLRLLVLELDVLRLLVDADEVLAVVEDRLDDLVRQILVH